MPTNWRLTLQRNIMTRSSLAQAGFRGLCGAAKPRFQAPEGARGSIGSLAARPKTASRAAPAASRAASPRGLPTSCRPMGRPCGVRPQGMQSTGSARQGDGIGDPDPFDVILEDHPLPFADPAGLDVEGRQDRGRHQQQIDIAHEAPHPVIELAPGALGPADIIGGEAAAMLDVPDDLGLQLVALLLVFLAQPGGEARGAQGLEDLRRIGEIGGRRHHIHALARQQRDGGVGHLAHRRGHPADAEIGRIGDPPRQAGRRAPPRGRSRPAPPATSDPHPPFPPWHRASAPHRPRCAPWGL